jgi:rubredoxin
MRGVLLSLLEREGNRFMVVDRPPDNRPAEPAAAGTCPGCGYDLTGLPRRWRCPECGTAFDQDQLAAPGRERVERYYRGDRLMHWLSIGLAAGLAGALWLGAALAAMIGSGHAGLAWSLALIGAVAALGAVTRYLCQRR